MKPMNFCPSYSADKFLKKNNESMEFKLMISGLKLKVFDYLSIPIEGGELAEKLSYNKKNLIWFLNALTAIELIEKKNGKFQNLNETQYFLNSQSDMYLGDFILYWYEMTNISNLEELIKNGAKYQQTNDRQATDFFDFRAMGQGNINLMYLGRVQEFLRTIEPLYKKNDSIKILDLGCGTGILSIEMLRMFPNARAVLYDQKYVTDLTRKIVLDYQINDRVSIQSGDFVKDEIKGNYDFIIASGIMDFVGELDTMVKKIKRLLRSKGRVYVSSHGIKDDFTEPKDKILGWLSSQLNGLSNLKTDSRIIEAFENNGFSLIVDSQKPGKYIASIR